MSTDTDLEKMELSVAEKSNDECISRFTPEQQRRIIRQIDWHLVVPLGVLYCTSLMDKINLDFATIAGMYRDLKLAGTNRYSLISWIFFMPYVLFQPPATVVLWKVGPQLFLTTIVVSWGATMIGFGFCPDWQTMMGRRVILGALEAGFFPGCAYLLSTWYTQYELQTLNAAFYFIGSMASAFRWILAYGFQQMDGKVDRAGW